MQLSSQALVDPVVLQYISLDPAYTALAYSLIGLFFFYYCCFFKAMKKRLKTEVGKKVSFHYPSLAIEQYSKLVMEVKV